MCFFNEKYWLFAFFPSQMIFLESWKIWFSYVKWSFLDTCEIFWYLWWKHGWGFLEVKIVSGVGVSHLCHEKKRGDFQWNPGCWKLGSKNFMVYFQQSPHNWLLINPGRLTWNTIMEVWKIMFLSKWVICRFHVNLSGCKSPTNHQQTTRVPWNPTPHRGCYCQGASMILRVFQFME